MEDFVRFFGLLYEWVIGPLMTLIEISVSDLTGMPPSLVSSIAQIIFMVLVCNYLWASIPEGFKVKLVPNPVGLGNVVFVVITGVAWITVNFVYGTYGIATYLWGDLVPIPIRTILALLPSSIQWMYMLNPPTDLRNRNIERTVILVDYIATVFGLAVAFGHTPSEYVLLLFEAPFEFLMIAGIGYLGNMYSEESIFQVVMKTRVGAAAARAAGGGRSTARAAGGGRSKP